MSTRRSPLRAFAGRYLVAFVTSAVVMVGAVVAVNYVIDRKLSHIPRVNVDTASAPSAGANYLVIGSDTRAFVDNPTQEDAFGNKSETGGQRSVASFG